MYTIMVAAMDRQVVAVDAMAENLAYISRSLNIINKTEQVVLVHNHIRYNNIMSNIHCDLYFSLSNNHVELFPVLEDEENPGSQKLVEEKQLQKSHLMVD